LLKPIIAVIGIFVFSTIYERIWPILSMPYFKSKKTVFYSLKFNFDVRRGELAEPIAVIDIFVFRRLQGKDFG